VKQSTPMSVYPLTRDHETDTWQRAAVTLRDPDRLAAVIRSAAPQGPCGGGRRAHTHLAQAAGFTSAQCAGGTAHVGSDHVAGRVAWGGWEE